MSYGGESVEQQNREWRVSRVRAEASAEQRFQDFEASLLQRESKERKEKKEHNKKKKKDHKKKKESSRKDKHKKKHKKRRGNDEQYDWVEKMTDVGVEEKESQANVGVEAPTREAWMIAPPKRETLITTSANSAPQGDEALDVVIKGENSASSASSEAKDWRLFTPRNRERPTTTSTTPTTEHSALERGEKERKYLNMEYENESSDRHTTNSTARRHDNNRHTSHESSFAGLRSTPTSISTPSSSSSSSSSSSWYQRRVRGQAIETTKSFFSFHRAKEQE
eukprot:TRINITY_DN5559_c0_g1_i1.p2 TRINITY_DN5559_c0_g1~~TRINITY_DN5559_c0_g1_i1.p2  ORF type:complete len:301 (-),score=107.81 TRINITY_DN5559_c0_g1_i1:1596-2435(-)